MEFTLDGTAKDAPLTVNHPAKVGTAPCDTTRRPDTRRRLHIEAPEAAACADFLASCTAHT
jgi:hypothetical protein